MLVDVDKLYPDVKTDKGLAISLEQITNAPPCKEAKAIDRYKKP